MASDAVVHEVGHEFGRALFDGVFDAAENRGNRFAERVANFFAGDNRLTGNAADRIAAADFGTFSGGKVEIKDVLMVGGDTPALGNPVAGGDVAAEVVAHERGAKVISFKKRRRKNSRRRRGHRQEFTLIRISEILADGAKPTKGPKPKPAKKPKAEKQEAAEA